MNGSPEAKKSEDAPPANPIIGTRKRSRSETMKERRIENLVAMPRKSHSPKSITEPYKIRILELERQLIDLKGGKK
jgi:hypothetical protein